MRIIFRADASREIGSGHVMRSSVIAEEAIHRGHECIFVGSIIGLDWVQKRIDKLGFARVCRVDEFASNTDNDVCVIDSYTEPIASKFGTKQNWRMLVSIKDDFTPKFDADALIIPSLVDEAADFSIPYILRGADFILVRKSIDKRPVRYPIVEPLRVIVSGGGSDPFGFAEEIARLIDQLNVDGVFHFFSNKEIVSFSGKQFLTHRFGESFDSIAENSHAVLTTASTSSLEFIAREIPSAVVSAVENQNHYYDYLTTNDLACGLGKFNLTTGWEISLENLKNFLLNNDYREMLSTRMSGLVDLKGAGRILDFIEKN
jgi:UDP-2,4-diacetamido-2,4,6-trideoxy-beta-L-altropyranose hydrolase